MAPDSIPHLSTFRGLALLRGPWGASLLSAALLVLIGLEVPNREKGPDPTAYHARIQAIAPSRMPYSVGDWLGKKVLPPAAAVELLRPNVIETREYQNLRTGESATVMFVHCSDARDLAGHYPPICYPANGLTQDAAESRDWTVGGIAIKGTRYRFSGSGLSAASKTVVDNFMLLPTGTIGRDMSDIRALAGDNRLHRLGAAEVQVVTDGTMSDERRDEVFRTLVEPTVTLIQCVTSEADRD